ncbi:uncharacterized protein LOC101894546 [Musca domestica]|uniref:Uncharacterized protein LOC101894546 n=1 Tax=Musca domestica TaxID=7370 RepID=A0A1I8MP91_MUSDO|nr:uncharacterized protein LOC101894546 [Musca domestica]
MPPKTCQKTTVSKVTVEKSVVAAKPKPKAAGSNVAMVPINITVVNGGRSGATGARRTPTVNVNIMQSSVSQTKRAPAASRVQSVTTTTVKKTAIESKPVTTKKPAIKAKCIMFEVSRK